MILNAIRKIEIFKFYRFHIKNLIAMSSSSNKAKHNCTMCKKHTQNGIIDNNAFFCSQVCLDALKGLKKICCHCGGPELEWRKGGMIGKNGKWFCQVTCMHIGSRTYPPMPQFNFGQQVNSGLFTVYPTARIDITLW
jgi:hypothetical protein